MDEKAIILTKEDRDWMTSLYAKLDVAQRIMDEHGQNKTLQGIVGEAKSFVTNIKKKFDDAKDIPDEIEIEEIADL